jgi:hypothetical protein
LGWPCPQTKNGTALTDFLVLDFDAKSSADAGAAAEAVKGVIDLFGEPWFVSTTPSWGYHGYWRLDRRMELGALMFGEKAGPVADRLAEIGLLVGKEHRIEVYPQRRRCLRGPLGTDQLLVDPVTMELVPLDGIEGALTYMARRMTL